MSEKYTRHTVIKEVPLGKMIVSDQGQRNRNDARVDHLLNEFDLDQIGYPIVSERGSYYYIIDGQHRVEALKRFLGKGWETQKIACAVYVGLTEQQEAEKFLSHNDTLRVTAHDKFKVGVTAGRETEVAIKRTVEQQGMKVTAYGTNGGICAVSTLIKIYNRAGANVLGTSIRIIRDSFGDAGFEAKVLDGIAHLVKRYNGQLDERLAKQKLGAMRGGVKGLINLAEQVKLRTGAQIGQCVAAAAVEEINRGRGGGKLPSWWKE